MVAACGGILVVEGFNDVIGLDAIGVPAAAVMSNKITEQQVAKVERWARLLTGGQVSLLFDADRLPPPVAAASIAFSPA
jgi:DNA primase